MSTRNELVVKPSKNEGHEFVDMFSDLAPIDPFDIKKESVAANLAALIAYAGKSRTAIAEEIGCHKSAVTRLLSGKNNTKIKTIWEVASHLGYDFDIVFHSDKEPIPKQPWQVKYEVTLSSLSTTLPEYDHIQWQYILNLQSAADVFQDFKAGNHASHYLSVMIPTENKFTCSVLEANISAPIYQSLSSLPLTVPSN